MVRDTSPMHPGKVLYVVFYEDMGSDFHKIAGELGWPESLLLNFLTGTISLTSDMAGQLENVSGLGAGVWMRMQERYDNWLIEN